MPSPVIWHLRYIIYDENQRMQMRRDFARLRLDPHVQHVEAKDNAEWRDVIDVMVQLVEGAQQPHHRELHALNLRYPAERSLPPTNEILAVRGQRAELHEQRVQAAMLNPIQDPERGQEAPPWLVAGYLGRETTTGREVRVTEVIEGTLSTRVRFVWSHDPLKPQTMPLPVFLSTFTKAEHDETPRTWHDHLRDDDIL